VRILCLTHSTVKIEMKLEGLEGILKTLQSLPAEVVSKRGGPVKLALAKGARVIAEEVKKNLRSITTGEDSTGFLLKNVIVSRGKQPINTKGERYLVRVRRKRYLDRKGKPVTTLKTAHILEYGSEKQKATPFIRPAALAKHEQAIRVTTNDLIRRLDKIVKDLARKNK
jgi:HK97 gp10 family phage protein